MEAAFIQNPELQELQKANQIIGQFINSCSHSMRGPLKSIAGLVGLLNNVDNSENDSKIFLGLIGKTALKMENMLDELEHFMENSKRNLNLMPIACQEVLDFTLTQYKEEIETKGIKIVGAVEQSAPLYSDLSRLRLIVAHLLANAIQFCDETKTKPEITITFKVDSEGCNITVSDNGVGIDPHEHLKIFQLFYRATAKSSGAGIGLYVVREVVEKMGGKVSVNSLLNKGAAFNIALPNPCKTE